MLNVSNEEIREGNLLRALLVLAVPLLAQNAVQIVQQIIDIVFLGRFSDDAVAAVGLATPLVGLLFVVTFTSFVGAQVVVSRRVGAEDTTGARQALFTGLGLALGLGGAVGAIGYLSAGSALDLLTAVRPDAQGAFVDLAAQYVGVLALGLPVLAFTDTLENGGFVAWGDSRAALWMNLVALGTNVALDALLIFGLGPFPRLGVQGAALATVLGSVAGGIVGLTLVARGRNGGMLTQAAATFDREALRGMLDVGGPVGAQQGIRQLLRVPIFVLVFVAGGGAGLAAYIIGARVATVAFVPPQSLQQAAQSVIGQNLGAGNAGRARQTTWLGVAVAVSGLTLIGTAQWLVPEALARAFVPTLSGDGLALTVEYLTVLAYGYPALGAIYTVEAGFNAAGRSRVSFLSTLLQYGGVRLPVAAVGVVYLSIGVSAVFWAVTVSNLLAALWLVGYYRYSVRAGMMRDAAEPVDGADAESRAAA